MSFPKVFVCGATGNQGGAFVQNLLEHGIQIHAVTRNISSDAAQNLRLVGVTLMEGDFDNEECLRKAMSSCTALFLNLTADYPSPFEKLDQARRILSVAKDVGIEQVIYTSSLGTIDPEHLQHWNPNSPLGVTVLGKQAIENEVRNAGFRFWTILRPGIFMTNFLDPHVKMYQAFVESGTFTTAFARDTVIPMVDPNDIGKFAAAAILSPAKFSREEIEVVSQMMGIEAVIHNLSEATGRDMRAVFLSEEEIKEQSLQDIFLEAQLGIRDYSRNVDLEKTKKWDIQLGNFAQFLEREKARVNMTYL